MTIFSESEREIAKYVYSWATGDVSEKARLYEQISNFRELFTSLPGNPFFLFEKINPLLWPELVSFDYGILSTCNARDADLLAKILQSLSPTDAAKEFRMIGLFSTREAIIERLTPTSKNLITQKLTEVEIEHMEKLRNDPYGSGINYFVASTKGLLDALPPSARACSSEYCVAAGKADFIDYHPFVMARCLKHSFHLACGPLRHDCLSNRPGTGMLRYN